MDWFLNWRLPASWSPHGQLTATVDWYRSGRGWVFDYGDRVEFVSNPRRVRK